MVTRNRISVLVFVASQAAFLLIGCIVAAFGDTPAATSQETAPLANSSVDLTLGGAVIFRLAGPAGGGTLQGRLDAVTDRLNAILAHPDIGPSDVVVYDPPGSPPEIYVLGRALVDVDSASAQASGIGTPLQTAVVWAKRLQQILPLVDIRLNGEPEPTVPPDPPLVVTPRLTEVGGSVGEVDWKRHLVISLSYSPIKSLTPAQYCDSIRLRLLDTIIAAGATPIVASTCSCPGLPAHSYDVMINSTRLITVTKDEAVAAGITSAEVLAEIWCGNLQSALSTPDSTGGQNQLAHSGKEPE